MLAKIAKYYLVRRGVNRKNLVTRARVELSLLFKTPSAAKEWCRRRRVPMVDMEVWVTTPAGGAFVKDLSL